MYHLYSHNDLDGIGCGIVARLAFGDQLEVRYNSVMGLDYQIEKYFERVNEKSKAEDVLLITDLSINEENAKRLDEYVNTGGKARLIDHHKTAVHFNQHSWGFVKLSDEDNRLTSATSLLYEYLTQQGLMEPSSALGEFVELVRQYDTWEWDQNNNVRAKQLNDLFFMLSIDDFEERMTKRIQSKSQFEFDDFEKKLLEMEDDKIERYIRRKNREIVQTFIGDYCAGIVHAESYHSELGNELGKGNPHLDYIAILNMGGKKISFRTIHDHVDVSAVAGEFGGGGHAKASGCSMGKEAFQLFVEKVFPIEPLRLDAFRNQFNLKGSVGGCLYESRQQERFFIYKGDQAEWIVEKSGQTIKETSSFEEAEAFIKRQHSAWLVRDDVFVEFLKKQVKKDKID
ncbi:DHH family phosphoesterase [Mesobacillus harenae]|uniref:DHH family phosphoesterase n=1 Tax=Mesobacillus harenae TaxID=2213203 RepID=UPI0015809835|nr:oligoribonuclease [Mesobacillus harenae]